MCEKDSTASVKQHFLIEKFNLSLKTNELCLYGGETYERFKLQTYSSLLKTLHLQHMYAL